MSAGLNAPTASFTPVMGRMASLVTNRTKGGAPRSRSLMTDATGGGTTGQSTVSAAPSRRPSAPITTRVARGAFAEP
ncbi:MAG: hypothetical protein IPI43_29360 [Sandaracinaceae bacterium]|nr:hypothetical protein [Sandaracinaceae bacterium]